MPPEQCPKHDEVMGRIFDDINSIKNSQSSSKAEIEAFIKSTQTFVDKIDRVTFGTENADGLLTKVSNIVKHLSVQWILIILVLSVVVTAGIAAIFSSGNNVRPTIQKQAIAMFNKIGG